MAGIYVRDSTNVEIGEADIRGCAVAVDVANSSKVKIGKGYFETDTGLVAKNVKGLSVSNATHNPKGEPELRPSSSKVFLPAKITLFSEHKKTQESATKKSLNPITFSSPAWHRYGDYRFTVRPYNIIKGIKNGDV